MKTLRFLSKALSAALVVLLTGCTPDFFPDVVIITTASLPSGTVGVSYTAFLAASGGQAPYSWAFVGGGLPPGLVLNSNGIISGTPTSAGLFNFTVQVTDSSSPVQTASRAFSIAVAMPPRIYLSALRPFSVDHGVGRILYDGDASMDMAGRRYYRGIRFFLRGGGGPRNVVYNLDGQYTRLTGLVGFDDDNPYYRERNISFYGDGRLLQVVTIKRAELPRPVNIDLTGVVLLRISLDNSWAVFDYDVNLANMLLE